jgi:hypothetical protein
VIFVKVDLARERAADLAVLTEDEYQKVFIFYASFIQVCLVIFLLLSLRCDTLIAMVVGKSVYLYTGTYVVPEVQRYRYINYTVVATRTSCGQRDCILMNVPSAGIAAEAATACDCQRHCTYCTS